MPVDEGTPDLETQVQLDAYAPRFARHCVAQVDSPSPDLRDAVELLTSEVVTRAVELYAPGRELVLRIWMPHDVVRVELEVGSDYTLSSSGSTGGYPQALLDGLADRWSIDATQKPASVWFEIDRHPPVGDPRDDATAGAVAPERGSRAERSSEPHARSGRRRERSATATQRVPSRSG